MTPILLVLASNAHSVESTGTVQVDNGAVGDYLYEFYECPFCVNEMKI